MCLACLDLVSNWLLFGGSLCKIVASIIYVIRLFLKKVCIVQLVHIFIDFLSQPDEVAAGHI